VLALRDAFIQTRSQTPR